MTEVAAPKNLMVVWSLLCLGSGVFWLALLSIR